MNCLICGTNIVLGGLIGKAGKAKIHCLKHWRERHKVTKQELKAQIALRGHEIKLGGTQ